MREDDSFMDVMRDYSIDPAFAHLHDAGEMPDYDFAWPDPKVAFIDDIAGSTQRRVINDLLMSVGWDRDEAYITSVVKYCPKESRPPSAQEVAASLPYLRRELRLLKPKILCTLGSHALRAVVSEAPVLNQVHGPRLHTRKGRPVLALTRPHVTPMLLNDFKVMAEWLKEDFE